MNIFNFKKGSLFPIQFQFFGLILFILGVAIFRNHPIISLIPVAVIVLIFTGQMGIEFDRSNNTWKEYNSFFFCKIRKGHHLPGRRSDIHKFRKATSAIFYDVHRSLINFFYPGMARLY